MHGNTTTYRYISKICMASIRVGPISFCTPEAGGDRRTGTCAGASPAPLDGIDIGARAFKITARASQHWHAYAHAPTPPYMCDRTCRDWPAA